MKRQARRAENVVAGIAPFRLGLAYFNPAVGALLDCRPRAWNAYGIRYTANRNHFATIHLTVTTNGEQ